MFNTKCNAGESKDFSCKGGVFEVTAVHFCLSSATLEWDSSAIACNVQLYNIALHIALQPVIQGEVLTVE